MLRFALKAKIHGARVTDVNLRYDGSLEVDEELLTAASIEPNELVQVVNLNSGARFQTYAIKGEKGSGRVSLNGGAARLGCVGDELLVLTYCSLDPVDLPSHKPRIIKVDEKNRPMK